MMKHFGSLEAMANDAKDRNAQIYAGCGAKD